MNEEIKQLEAQLDENKDCTMQELQKQRKEFDNLISANISEVEMLRQLIDEQKQQLITAYTEHEEKLESVDGEIANYNKQISHLQEQLKTAQSHNDAASNDQANVFTQQIQSLQSQLNENQKRVEQHTEELANKQSTIESLNQQIMDLYKSMETHTMDIADKDDEIEHLQNTVDQNKAELKKLNQSNLADKHRIKELAADVQQKSTEWTEMDKKFKEQHEKLKKFAANLKKRNAQCIELEERCAQLQKTLEEQPEGRVVVQEVHVPIVENVALQQASPAVDETIRLQEEIEQLRISHANEIVGLRADIDHKLAEIHALNGQLREAVQRLDVITSESDAKQNEIHEMQVKLEELQAIKAELVATNADLKAKNIKIEKCKAVIKEKNKEIKRLQEIEQAMKERSSDVSANELKMDLDQLQTEKDKISLDYENYRTFIDTKLQNNELVIESMDTDNKQLKERISRLEESICKAEEHRSMLEHHSELMDTQLKEKQTQIESAEDEFSAKLQMLIHQDQLIEQKLKNMESERDHLMITIKDQETHNDNLKHKNIALERRLDELESNRIVDLEADNKDQSERIEKLESEVNRKQDELNHLTAAKNAELSELENELSNHLKKIEHERRTIQEELERSREENAQLIEQTHQLQEAHASLDQIRIDLELQTASIKLQNDNMTHDHLEAQDLRMQIVQYQTEIENLRMQNVDLSSRYTNELNGMQIQLQEAVELRSVIENQARSVKDEFIQENDSLKSKICEDQAEIVNLRLMNEQMTNDHEAELTNLHGQKQVLENEVTILRQQITELNALQVSVGQNLTQDQIEVQQLRVQINQDQNEIETLRHQLQQMTSTYETESTALRQQIAELDSLRMQVGQNQTDDQVFIQNENGRLQSLLAEKEIEIQNYQRQNLQLQMSAGMAANDPFAAIAPPQADNAELTVLSTRVVELENRLEAALRENSEIHARYVELQRVSIDNDVEIARLQDTAGDLMTTAGDLMSVNEPIAVSHEIQTISPVDPFDLQAVGGADSNADQQIEDLQRNVSDLEKYVTDLEHKLKAAHEEIAKNHTERAHVELNVANRTQQFEEQILQLQGDLARQRDELETVKAQQLQAVPVQEHVLSTASLFSVAAAPTANVLDGFAAASEPDYSGQVPVVEETIVPKNAYVCHPSNEPALHGFGDDDNWSESVWGNEEAVLEEQHQQTIQADQSAISNRVAATLQLEIDELKQERERNATESTALQTKYKKLMKKLREYKDKIDELEQAKAKQPQPAAQAFEFDNMIQDELNNQVKSLEQRVKELKAEQEKDAQEKKKLLSRIDVLTSGNDRMVEMKDRQDVEIEVCKAKIRELNGLFEKRNVWDDHAVAESSDEVAARLAETQNQNRLLEERVSRMQASVTGVDDFEDEREQYLEQLRVMSAEKVMLEENINIRENEIATLTDKLTALESQNNDFRATIEVLSVESNNIKTLLDQLKEDHTQKISENNDLSEKLKELMDKNVSLATQMDEMRIYNLSSQNVEQRIQDLNASIQYKDSEIGALNDKIDTDKRGFEENFDRLQIELSSNEKTIGELKEEIQRLQSEKEEADIVTVSEITGGDLSVKVAELQKHIEQLQSEKAEMENELHVLNDQVLKNLETEDRTRNIVLELDMKNIEITELKNTISQLNDARSNMPHEDVTVQWQQQLHDKDNEHQAAINSMNLQWQQVVDEKCAELADSWRQHVQVREDEFAAIENDLRTKISQFEAELSKSHSPTSDIQQLSKSSELSSTDSQQQSTDLDQSEMMKTMEKALEAQEIEIVSLKEQLAIRSAEYARIAASVDPYGMKRGSIASNERPPEEAAPKGNDLDLALYVLHQRDMRCEELTAEVIQLLEERDTLQLKLSNAIRKFEEFKRRCGFDGNFSDKLIKQL